MEAVLVRNETQSAQPLDWPAFAEASPLLASLPERVRDAARLVHVSRSGRLFSHGDVPKAMFFIVSGEVHLVRQSPQGNELVLQRAQGGILAEASLDQPTYHCDAVAIMPSVLLRLPRKALLDALADKTFRTRWIAHLTRELRRVRAQAERMHLKSAEDRVVHYIATEGENGTIRLSQSKKGWANELGLTHEALYRTLARMKRNGRISVNGNVLSIRC